MSEHRTPDALLLDYGQVISLPQPEETPRAMAAAAGVELGALRERYWSHRVAYDKGGSAAAYWSAVVGRPLDERTVAELSRLDVEGWGHLNSEVMAILAHARERGWTLSLLSNAPHDLARALASVPALSQFEHLCFSAQLGLAKPDPAAYVAVLARIGKRADEVLFVDDRPANVEGARSVGIESIRFTSAAGLRDRLLLT